MYWRAYGEGCSLIVEFVGLPGSGKTTIAKEIYDRGNIAGNTVDYPLYIFYKKSWISRNVSKLLNIFFFAVVNPLVFLTIIKMVVTSGQKRPSDYFRLSLNSVYIISIIKKFSTSENIVLFDEGILHHGWAIKLGAKKSVDFEKYLRICGPDSIIIHVFCDKEVVKERMINRGKLNSRHKFIKDDLEKSEKLMHECLRYTCGNLISLENSKPGSMVNNADEIVKILESRYEVQGN